MLNQTKIVVDGQIKDIFNDHTTDRVPYRYITIDRQFFPKIVCLCGSSKFKDEFDYAAQEFTRQGCIVLTMAMFTHHAKKIGDPRADDFDRIKGMLDELHKRKIDLSDEVFVINANDYIGESTKSEIEYAKGKQKPISYWNDTGMSNDYYFMKRERDC